ncbi:unnamed protein product [Didymodactylos carnosus]|uniref:Uncharacterized protein n=1 Tax=Didymodactylos carnosus TaxID=1234261 RepID=A0A814MMX9_9BILA|nr:unnamed protein product [Didymodactylos carnosus]CAF1172461.1 unnamed protein product [Didymodactylos carnosus]CAF3847424.1 unnamed protein product [Didymodactylos carnosus]CAF3983754.1 unnamed protein product [Didymodactylos carnosus]
MNGYQTSEDGLNIPYSPCEPGKFDFYRIHQAKDCQLSEEDDGPTLSTLTPAIGKTTSMTRSPFADYVHNLNSNTNPLDIPNNILKTNENTFATTVNNSLSNSVSASSFFLPDESKTDTDNPIKETSSSSALSTLTNAVKNVISPVHLSTDYNHHDDQNHDHQDHGSICLSGKELNYLVPQSM